ncbi:MAG TPA: hypothetical protein VFQ61_09470, partial [Polyangiaceae bacterium]|nr:hypothetical protein [Polyangiaceae bacterium]
APARGSSPEGGRITPTRAERETASDGIPIAPAGSTAIPSAEPHHPHPITPQHERIYAENNLVASLAGALDVRDTARIRRLVAEYRERYPEDDHQIQAGYEIIANCLDHPGPDTKAAAQRYYDEELGSNIRRYVRRHCLIECGRTA